VQAAHSLRLSSARSVTVALLSGCVQVFIIVHPWLAPFSPALRRVQAAAAGPGTPSFAGTPSESTDSYESTASEALDALSLMKLILDCLPPQLAQSQGTLFVAGLGVVGSVDGGVAQVHLLPACSSRRQRTLTPL
jgi:hypothetical protein